MKRPNLPYTEEQIDRIRRDAQKHFGRAVCPVHFTSMRIRECVARRTYSGREETRIFYGPPGGPGWEVSRVVLLCDDCHVALSAEAGGVSAA